MKINMEINDELLKHGGFNERDIKMMIGVALYNNRVASTGKASEIIGIERRDFLDEMGKYGGILFDGDIKNVMKEGLYNR